MQESNQSAIREIKMIPDDLMARVQRLADAEGITAAEFIVRCVDDAVTHAEAANAELDAVEGQDVEGQPGTVHAFRTSPSQAARTNMVLEGLEKMGREAEQRAAVARAEREANRQRLEDRRQQSVEGLRWMLTG
jgi:predicted transcriptional regulator